MMRTLSTASACLVLCACSNASATRHEISSQTMVQLLQTAPTLSSFALKVTRRNGTAGSVIVERSVYDLENDAYENTTNAVLSKPLDELSVGADLYVRVTDTPHWERIVRPPQYFPRVRTQQPGVLFVPAVQQSKVVDLGKAIEQGVTTEHYRAVESYNTYLTLIGVTAPEGASGDVTTDLYLDSLGRPRRIEQNLPPSGVTSRVYSDLNAPVHLQAPPASDVVNTVTVKSQEELTQALGHIN